MHESAASDGVFAIDSNARSPPASAIPRPPLAGPFHFRGECSWHTHLAEAEDETNIVFDPLRIAELLKLGLRVAPRRPRSGRGGGEACLSVHTCVCMWRRAHPIGIHPQHHGMLGLGALCASHSCYIFGTECQNAASAVAWLKSASLEIPSADGSEAVP